MAFVLVVKDSEEESFDTNLSGMDMIISVLEEAGVQVDVKRERDWGSPDERTEVEASLRNALSTNDGWHILREEATEIAEALRRFRRRYVTVKPSVISKRYLRAKEKRVHLSEDDLDHLDEFAAFSEMASRKGGFYVY